MKKDILETQKKEIERLRLMTLISRDKETEAKKWLDSNLIKVILGPRRSGKSVFSFLLLRDRSFAYVNFDDEKLLEGFDMDMLIADMKIVYGDTKNLLFDEIQNVPNWELMVNRLQRQGYNLVITGSNANLLGKELATHLTGRHISIELLPFNFNEFLRAKHINLKRITMSEKLVLLHGYLFNGGYPEIVIHEIDPRGYLGVLFDSLILKDVVVRYHIRRTDLVKRVGEYMISIITQRFSSNNVMCALGEKSDITIGKYISYLSDAYLIILLTRYAHSPKKRANAERKIYTVDNGFISARAISSSSDNGKYFENLVFTELLKRGYIINQDVFYYQTRNGKEVDFCLKNNNTFSLLQVAYLIDNPKTEKREIGALLEASEELRVDDMIVITFNTEKVVKKEGKTINCIPLWKWLEII